jgi:hypothetical protein
MVAADASGDRPAENIFKIMDEIVRQLNRTKKMFILMIVSIIVVVPATHIVANILVGDTFRDGGPPFDRDGPPGGGPIPGAIVAGVVIAWIVIGVRQWLILNKWTRKYETYKELQRKIDEKLDFEKDEGEEGGEKKSSSGND